MIADMINNEKLNSTATELFITGRKLNISLVSITQSYFEIPKDVRLNTSHFFVAKIPDKRELPNDFTNIYRKCTTELYSLLVNDTKLASNYP